MKLNKYGFSNIGNIRNDILLLSTSNYHKHFYSLNNENRILEIGPGNGAFSFYLKDKYRINNENFILIDKSESVIDLLNKQEETKNFNNILIDSIEFFTKNKINFDYIIIRHVLEHMKKDYINDLIPLMINSLNIGGKIIIEVPNLGCYPNGVYMYFCDYSHYTGFTDKSIGEAFYWNSNQNNIDLKTYNYFKNINFRGKFIFLIKDIIAYLIELLSFVISFIFLIIFGNWTFGKNKKQNKRVFTPILMAVITKK